MPVSFTYLNWLINWMPSNCYIFIKLRDFNLLYLSVNLAIKVISITKIFNLMAYFYWN